MSLKIEEREERNTVQLRGLLVLSYTVFPSVAPSLRSNSAIQSNQKPLFLPNKQLITHAMKPMQARLIVNIS